MKAVLMSIHPKWCELIFSGEKTIEVRKTAPKLETPFKVYVYCTKEKIGGGYLHTSNHKDRLYVWSNPDDTEIRIEPEGYTYTAYSCRGKVIGEFVCDKVRDYIPFGLRGYELPSEWLKNMCLSKEQLDQYGGLKTLHGLHITEPKIYDKPREVGEFKTPDKPYHKIIEREGSLMFMDGYESGKPLKRAPQSWQFVEEVEE